MIIRKLQFSCIMGELQDYCKLPDGLGQARQFGINIYLGGSMINLIIVFGETSVLPQQRGDCGHMYNTYIFA